MRWKRSRRRGVSVGRIASHVVLLAAAGAFGVFYARPAPSPVVDEPPVRWLQTPPFDMAIWENRSTLRMTESRLTFDLEGRRLRDECAGDPDAPRSAVLVLGEGWTRYPDREIPERRTTIRIFGGEAIVERTRFDHLGDGVLGTQRLRLGQVATGQVTAMLIEGGYAEMPPAARLTRICDPGRPIVLQSCIDGRYYAVARRCGSDSGSPDLGELTDRLHRFIDAEAERQAERIRQSGTGR